MTALYSQPLVALKLIHPSKSPPDAIPSRPPSLPSYAPFGKASSSSPPWLVETYAFPAAFPRSIVGSSRSKSASSSSRVKKAINGRLSGVDLDAVREDIFARRREAALQGPDVSKDIGSDQLWITVNKYAAAAPLPFAKGKRRQTAKEPLTLVFAHANGFSKETWEPTIAHLLALTNEGQLGPIDEIWALDIVNQGDAAILNKDTLGDQFDWADNGRDILHFILNYLPEFSADESVASHSQANQPPQIIPETPVTKEELRTTAVDANLPTDVISSTAFVQIGTPTLSKLGYHQAVQGYMTEVEEMSSISRPDSTSSTAAPLLPAKVRDSESESAHLVPTLLPLQPLPSNMQDALLLDLSSSSAINNMLRPLPKQRWRNRRIALIGHSVGAAGMVFTSSVFPHLFKSLILVDPTIFPSWVQRMPSTAKLTDGALTRREEWASRAEAKSTFQKSKTFYGRWDPDVLDRFVNFGLMEKEREDGSERRSSVVLKVDKMQEAYVYADVDNHGSKRVFNRLSYLPKSIKVCIIRADVGMSTVPEEAYEDFEQIVKHARHSRIGGSAHLVAQEKPYELAQEIGACLRDAEANLNPHRAKL